MDDRQLRPRVDRRDGNADRTTDGHEQIKTNDFPVGGDANVKHVVGALAPQLPPTIAAGSPTEEEDGSHSILKEQETIANDKTDRSHETPSSLLAMAIVGGSRSKVLVIGATGRFGQELVKASLAAGHPTYALVREPTFSLADASLLLRSFSASGVTLLKVVLAPFRSVCTLRLNVNLVSISLFGNLVFFEKIPLIGQMPTWPPSHHAPRTVRPLTWPNQRDWSKDTSYRTADLAQVRSATPTCRRTPHHQYGKRGGKRGSTSPYGRPGTSKVGNPHLQAHASPPVQQAWQEARQH
ncbi:hypothetical protein GW17_00051208, partial [Ensete ventricosum]